jgi:hypothetical protein
MHVVSMLAAAIVALGAAAASAQPVYPPSGAARYAVNPSLSLTPRANSPIQQQVQRDYRTQLLSAQRELQQANPSGTSPEQLEITHLLNTDSATPR